MGAWKKPVRPSFSTSGRGVRKINVIIEGNVVEDHVRYLPFAACGCLGRATPHPGPTTEIREGVQSDTKCYTGKTSHYI